jgi:hypothetical protein
MTALTLAQLAVCLRMWLHTELKEIGDVGAFGCAC